MATLYAFRNFNNYYNRRLKKFESLDDYPEPDYTESGTYCNFNPNDGINTSIVLGRPGNNPYDGDCDYFIYSADNLNITSRWYIIENQRKMGEQYAVTLHRDVLADNWDKILSSDCFIEKAILPSDSNLIFNSEDMTVNQIKWSETLLQDETKVGWIIGYIQRSYEGGSLAIAANAVADYQFATKAAFQSDFGTAPNVDIRPTDTDNTFRFFCTQGITSRYGTNFGDYEIRYNLTTQQWTLVVPSTTYQGTAHYPWKFAKGATTTQTPQNYVPSAFEVFQNSFDTTYFTNNVTSSTPAAYRQYYSDARYNKIRDATGQVLEVTTGADVGYYRLDVTTEHHNYYYDNTSGNLITYINNFISTNSLGSGAIAEYRLYRDTDTISYDYTEVAFGNYTLTFPAITARLHLKDAPYDMFCIPYGDVTIRNSKVAGWTNFTLNPSLSLSIAQGIAQQVGKDNIIDLQLVPYCPMTGFKTGTSGGVRYIDINNSDTHRYNIVKDSDNTDACCIIWTTASSGTKTLSYTLSPTNYKMVTSCHMYRFVSPNYSGQFEFDGAKNGGFTSINVDFTYLPYQPYIHVNPTFGRLYGSNFGDARGLICSGDFSISYLSDAWVDYQTRNKNYQNIFDREIQNMDVSHTWEMRQAKVAAAAGVLGGAVSGATTGAAAGPWGAVAGAIAGGAASAVGGALDIKMKESLYSEALDYKNDMFGFQLDNIKALPYSLAKVSAINQNNKIFPFLEHYRCSEEEMVAFANKIAWNSMTVGVIGQIQDYINNSWSYSGITDKGYIKARLIRFDDANEDFHNVNAIADELYKGVYTK